MDEQPQTEMGTDPGNITVLVAEDDNFTRMVLQDILETEGYQVIAVPDGREALTQVTSGVTIDLILSDINMPEMNGLELIAQVRAAHYAMPIIVLTGNDDISVALTAMQNGAGNFLVKDGSIRDTVPIAVRQILEKESIKQSNKQLAAELLVTRKVCQTAMLGLVHWVCLHPLASGQSMQQVAQELARLGVPGAMEEAFIKDLEAANLSCAQG